jgi:hypothetical protein
MQLALCERSLAKELTVFARSKVESRPFAIGLISIIASGCAAGFSNQPHGRAAGEWNVTLPSVASYSQGLAYGRGGSSARAVEADVDALLLADAYMPRVAEDQTKKKPVQRKPRADQTPPASREPAPSRTAPEPVVPAPSRAERIEVALADPADLGRYEARQAQSPAQQAFAGGDAIVIGASTLLIVILIVLLVLLLV